MRNRISSLLGAAGMAAALVPGGAWAQSSIGSDKDHAAPFDYGFGRGVRVPTGQVSVWNRVANAMSGKAASPFETQQSIAALPHSLVAPPVNGGPNAAIGGVFGPVLAWPIVPLHMALLPDGRVMNYGTNEQGQQGAAMFYDIWDPTQPYETSQTVLPNTTSTDIFCSGLGLLPNGSLLMTGGDKTISGVRNFSNSQVTVFTPGTNQLVANGTMSYPRWYPSDVPLASGDHFIVGGRSGQEPTVPVTVPEYYSVAANSFTTMPGANFTNKVSWYYPKVFTASSGTIYLLDLSGNVATFTTGGAGTFKMLGIRAATGLYDLPTVMSGPSTLLSIRGSNAVSATSQSYTFDKVDLSGKLPVITQLASVPGMGREWSNMTVLADGTVFVNGGSGGDNVTTRESLASALYNPVSGAWTVGAAAAQPRLYHSASLLLPDGTVLTGGGGAPGPVDELNAEIYYPPYLFTNDGSGNFAPRPVIAAAPSSVLPGSVFTVTMADATPIGAVNLMRVGAVTHSTSVQARFVPAAFSQNGTVLTVTAPANSNDLLTGYWMMFALNSSGVPSVAAMVQVPQPGVAPSATH